MQEQDDFDGLLRDVTRVGVTARGALAKLLQKHKSKVLARDAAQVAKVRGSTEEWATDPLIQARLVQGVFYSHTGLTRIALEEEFGDIWRDQSGNA
jgi:hypothetical protein